MRNTVLAAAGASRGVQGRHTVPMGNSGLKPSRLVISVCAGPDLEVWKWSSALISRRLIAETFLVIGPPADLSELKLASAGEWQAEEETNYVKGLPGLDLEALRLLAGDRYGWYVQQFAKMGAMFIEKDYDEYLIWDSDTLPTRQLAFATDAGRVPFYSGSESHEPYFRQIKNFLGYDKLVSESFIAQCLMMKRSWVDALEGKLIQTHGAEWGSSLLDSIDFSENYGFSEYEMLGTFVSHEFPREYFFNARNWTRNGTLYMRHPKNMRLFPFARQVWDFVSFESWQKPWWRRETLRPCTEKSR